jgi:hypothetical protein
VSTLGGSDIPASAGGTGRSLCSVLDAVRVLRIHSPYLAGIVLVTALSACTTSVHPVPIPVRPSPRLSVMFLPEPSPQPPPNARRVLTGAFGQWADYGTRITAMWVDLEAGKLVRVKSEVPTFLKRNPSVSVYVIELGIGGTPGINGFVGCTFTFPGVRRLTLVRVSGSVPARSLRIVVRFQQDDAGERLGTLNPFGRAGIRCRSGGLSFLRRKRHSFSGFGPGEPPTRRVALLGNSEVKHQFSSE